MVVRRLARQARCARDEHSLHLTISANQANTFADLLEIAIPGALAIACEDQHAFRQSLPPDYVSFMGVMHSDKVILHPFSRSASPRNPHAPSVSTPPKPLIVPLIQPSRKDPHCRSAGQPSACELSYACVARTRRMRVSGWPLMLTAL